MLTANQNPDSLYAQATASNRPWHLVDHNAKEAVEISQRLDVAEIVGRVLSARNINLEQAVHYLNPKLKHWLPDPSHLLDMDKAARRIADAIAKKEKIGVIGDYDVDGATSSSIFYLYCQHFGCPCEVEIPHRIRDGYGPNETLIRRLKDEGCTLLLTLDNGTTAYEELKLAKDLGLDAIVIDHHLAEAELPETFALVNPNRTDQISPLSSLAAVGVTFMTIVAINRLLREQGKDVPDALQWLDLVALGTVCDVVPLEGLNRAFVRQGLKVAGQSKNCGLKELAKISGVKFFKDPRSMGFSLGPRINAAGRLGESRIGFELLSCSEEDRAQRLANKLDQLNKQRQALERQYVRQAQAEAEKQGNAPLTIVSGEGWHVGVVGVVASRLVDKFKKPAIVIGFENGTGRGSGRSVSGFDLGSLIIEARNKGLLLKGGGHAMAAGLTLSSDQLETFREFAFEQFVECDNPGPATMEPLMIDAELAAGGINLNLAYAIQQTGPFGPGNPEPIFAINHARILRPRIVGNGHLSCLVQGPCGSMVQAIAFKGKDSPLEPYLSPEYGSIRLAGYIRANEYQGRVNPQLEILDAAR